MPGNGEPPVVVGDDVEAKEQWQAKKPVAECC